MLENVLELRVGAHFAQDHDAVVVVGDELFAVDGNVADGARVLSQDPEAAGVVDVNDVRLCPQGISQVPKGQEAVLAAHDDDAVEEGRVQHLGLVAKALQATVGLQVVNVEHLQNKRWIGRRPSIPPLLLRRKEDMDLVIQFISI